MSCRREKDSPDVSIFRYSSHASRDFRFMMSAREREQSAFIIYCGAVCYYNSNPYVEKLLLSSTVVQFGIIIQILMLRNSFFTSTVVQFAI